MGTTWTVLLPDTRLQPHAPDPFNVKHLAQALQNVLNNIVAQMSTWDASSTISRLNHASKGWYQVEPECYRVLEAALSIAGLSDGAYDPTLNELINLWGFGPAGPRSAPPDPAELRQAMLRSGWRKTALNPDHRGVWQPGGLQFDLSSIAKGYGVDEMARVLDEHGHKNYLVELGGELKARGCTAKGQPWRITIDQAHLPINLNNKSVATSGDYRRHFEHNGRRYAHTLDARTGQPLQHALASVTVLHDQCLLADACATALLCLGPDAGPAMAKTHGLAALFLERDNNDFKVFWTPAFASAAGLTEHTALIGNDCV